MEVHFVEGVTPAPGLPMPEREWKAITIHGKSAFVERFRHSDGPTRHYPLNVRVYVPDVGDGRRSLRIRAHCADDEAQMVAERIIESIRFLPPDSRRRPLPPAPPPP
jgi:hypothetical protein